MSSKGPSDAIILCIVLASILSGAVIGFFTPYLDIGIFLLSLTGGVSAGLRLVLVKKELLVPNSMVDWVVIGLFGLSGAVLFIIRRHISMVVFGFLYLTILHKLINLYTDRWVFPLRDISCLVGS